jgi:tRNA-binding EMAP/Myf-like protein
MAYCAYIVKIKELRQHSNADRLQVATVFGNNVIVSLETKIDDMMCYFPTDGRLNVEYCRKNKLLREKDANGNNIGGYMDESKCNVTTIKLRGEKSDGLLLSISSLSEFTKVEDLKEGDTISVLNGIVICEKYIPRGSRNHRTTTSSKEKRKKKDNKISFPFFSEHSDTTQWAYNKHQFKYGDICYITLKMHGTSARTSLSLKEERKILPYWIHNILKNFKFKLKSKTSWDYVSGTRRVVLSDYQGGYYGNDEFRKKWHDFFVGKLKKGEEAYYEILGYISEDKTIMPECSNAKTKDKEFIKKWGDTTRFTYGCEVGQNDIYVYRMTMTNEDGDVVEYPTELVKLRCEQMGVKFVPIFDKFIFTTIEDLEERVEKFVDGEDPIGKTHIKEGIVIRVDNKEKFTAFKHKNTDFKILEGIIKTQDNVLDIEEEQDIIKEEELQC